MTEQSSEPAQSPRAKAPSGLAKFLGRPEVRAALLLTAVLAPIGIVFSQLEQYRSSRQHLGAEYYNIARALVDGRGFSDPFGERTGPTAWMPPVFPMILAIALYLGKSRVIVAGVVLVLMNLTWVGIGTSLYWMARRAGSRIPPLFALVLVLGWALSFDYWFFVCTTDIWLQAAVVTLITLAIFDHLTTGAHRPVSWGLLTGAALLVSPTLGFATAALSLVSLLQAKTRRQPWLTTLAIALLVMAPWTVRNAVVFKQFIPIKSNAANELYQANVVDDDGVFDSVNQQVHPFNRLDSRFQYGKLGEIAYVKDRGQVFWRVMRDDWRHLSRNIGNRAVAMVVYHPLAKIMDGPIGGPIRHAVYASPILVLLASISVRGPHRRMLRVLAFFCLAYLVPYVAAAFYIRYFLVLTPVFLTILYFGIDQLAERWSSRGVKLAPSPKVN